MKKLIAIALVLSTLLLAGCRKDSSIGIIGGADGPTSIFIAESK